MPLEDLLGHPHILWRMEVALAWMEWEELDQHRLSDFCDVQSKEIRMTTLFHFQENIKSVFVRICDEVMGDSRLSARLQKKARQKQ